MRPGNRLAPLVAAILALAGSAIAKEIPFLTGRVNDTAGMVPAEVRERVEGKLAQLEKASGAQIAVLTIASLEGEPLEEYSLKVAQTWKLGRKGVDDGALLLVARDDRKMRIEVGYGLEAKLTDIACKRILDDVVRPAFRDGDFGKGIESGVDAMIGTAQGKDVLPPPGSAARNVADIPFGPRLLATLLFVVVVGTFSFLALFSQGCQSWFLYAFLIPFYGAFLPTLWGFPGGVVALGWLFGFPIAKLFLGKTSAGKSFMAAHPGLVAAMASSGHSGSGGGWSSGSSGGGFSGGGGSFGGGGSSSSW